MTRKILSQRERELIAVGGSVAADCVNCSRYHFRQAFEQVAGMGEVPSAVIGPIEVVGEAIAEFTAEPAVEN